MATGELTSTGASWLADLSNVMADAVERVGASTVRVDARQGLGASGLVWTSGGLIVTAAHVIQRDEEILVGMPDGSELAADLVGRERSCDLALLKVDQERLATASIAPSDSLRVGNLVLALGRPDLGGVAASMGIVSAAGGKRRVRHDDPTEGYIWTDVGMYPGFSGGPLIDVQGRLVGMNSSGLGSIANMALPVNVVARVVEDLLRGVKDGYTEANVLEGESRPEPVVRQGFLGLRTEEVNLPRSLAEQMGLQSGLFVLVVGPDGPADRAGIQRGDILVGLDDQPLRELAELQALITAERIGTTVEAVVIRGDEILELEVTIGERP